MVPCPYGCRSNRPLMKARSAAAAGEVFICRSRLMRRSRMRLRSDSAWCGRITTSASSASAAFEISGERGQRRATSRSWPTSISRCVAQPRKGVGQLHRIAPARAFVQQIAGQTGKPRQFGRVVRGAAFRPGARASPRAPSSRAATRSATLTIVRRALSAETEPGWRHRQTGGSDRDRYHCAAANAGVEPPRARSPCPSGTTLNAVIAERSRSRRDLRRDRPR